jgi:hydroxyacylglutathione hydrolase
MSAHSGQILCRGWKLQYILNTHHHHDHTGGNAQLKKAYKCEIVGPKADEERIPLIDTALAEGESFHLGKMEFKVFDTPGHTKGHITFWAPEAKLMFPGDTLFAMGCGRLFEGTPQQMWRSLSKLKALPGDTQIYCGHEYTLNNAKCVSLCHRCVLLHCSW